MGLLLPLAVCLLLCTSFTGAFASGQPAATGLQCNEFPSTSHYGVVTSSCDKASDLATELLSEGANVGVLGGMRLMNDTVTGRYTMFRVNEGNMSIDGYGVWSNGAIYQIFDGITFLDAMEVNTSINGPVFDATFDSTSVRIHNHPGGLMEISAERSVSIKFQMAGGINSEMMTTDETGDASIEAARVGGTNISSTIVVNGGSLDQAGNRSLIASLARGGDVVVRAASDDTTTQSELLDALPSAILAEYWVLGRDDGAIYDLTAYRDVDFNTSSSKLKMGDWEIPLPDQLPGNVIGVHTDRMSVTIAGGIENMLSLSGSAPQAADSMEAVLQAADGNVSSAMYFMEQTNNRVDIYLYVPPGAGGVGSDGDSNTEISGPLDLGSLALPIGIGLGLVAVVAVALLFSRAKKK